MLKYIIKRLLLFLPTLVIISLLAFFISIYSPGDPVEKMMGMSGYGEQGYAANVNIEQQQLFWKKKLGLDLPVFYLGISSLANPDTLHRIVSEREQQMLESFIHQFGNWDAISNYYHRLKQFRFSLNAWKEQQNWALIADTLKERYTHVVFEVTALFYTDNTVVIENKLNSALAELMLFNNTKLLQQGKDVKQSLKTMRDNATLWKTYVPVVHFHGMNQYHRWLFGDAETGGKGVLRGDFGYSFHTRLPVMEMISGKISVSILFTLIPIFFAYFVSIPIGIHAAVHRNSLFDRVSTFILFLLYSLPSFFVATLLLMLFANPDVFAWFPPSGIKPLEGYPLDAGWWERIKLSLPHMVLPLICYTYSSFAFLSRTMRTAMLEVINQDYIRTARAKGLSERRVIYKHAFRNALLPIITVFSNIFPLAVGGSVILETIFSIPGIGYETYHAILNQDYPFIFAVFTITGFTTVVGYLVADILYAVADPRVNLST